MKSDVISSDKCNGCMACVKSCPKNCIEIYETDEGFLYPSINRENCIECGVCKRKCPNNYEIPINELQEVFAVQRREKTECMKSASGGIFSVMAEHVLKKKGLVFGATMDGNFQVYHRFINNIDQIDLLRGSKYVESDLRNTYVEAKKFLEKGRLVLFSGTPCQIAGLKSYLDKEYENLYTIDLICNGVPSRKVFANYVQWLRDKYQAVGKYIFRDKSIAGWSLVSSVETNNRKKYSTATLDPYNYGFEKLYFNRLSCYGCKYASERRISDITIGDFWGIQNLDVSMDYFVGVSACVINTFKGSKLFKDIQDEVVVVKSSMGDLQKGNTNIKQAKSKPKERDIIYLDLLSGGFEQVRKKYLTFRFYRIKSVLVQLKFLGRRLMQCRRRH